MVESLLSEFKHKFPNKVVSIQEEFITFKETENKDFEFDSGYEFHPSGISFVEYFDEFQAEDANILDISQNYVETTENRDLPFPDISTFSFEDSSTETTDGTKVDFNFLLTEGSTSRKDGRESEIKLNKEPSSAENHHLLDQDSTTPFIQSMKFEQQGNVTWNKGKAYFNIDVNQIENYYTSQGECLICSNKYASKKNAIRHIKLSHLKLREFVCPICPSEHFQASDKLKNHLKKFHPKFEILNLRQITKFREVHPRKLHLEGESKDDQACSSEPKEAKNSIKSAAIGWLKCQLCDEKFKVSSHLKAHMNKVHSNKEERIGKNSYNQVLIKKLPGNYSPNYENIAPVKKRTFKQKIIPYNYPIISNTNLKKYYQQKENMALLKSLIIDLEENQNENVTLQFNIKQETVEDIERGADTGSFQENRDTDGGFLLVQSNFNSNPTQNKEEIVNLQDMRFSPKATEFMASTPIAKKNNEMKDKMTNQQKKGKSETEKIESTTSNEKIRNRLKNVTSNPMLPNPIECTKCQKVMTNVMDFNNHMKEHWKLDKRCAMCNCAKSMQGNLLMHARLHSGETPYKCKSCQQSFKHHFQLKKHKQTKC